MKKNTHRDYITEQEFNRILVESGVIQLPQDDSKGDSRTNMSIEAEMGERYPDEAFDDIADVGEMDTIPGREDTEEEKIDLRNSDLVSHKSSTWPDKGELV